MSKTEKQEIGIWGEEQASLFLIRQGYKIIARNYGFKKGEIDIIGWTKDRDEVSGDWRKVLAFVEVKTRSFGHDSAERAVGSSKAGKIKQTAVRFCFEKKINPDETWIKFELVCVYYSRKNKKVLFKKYIIPSWLFEKKGRFKIY
ncbi:YraN family protein [Patescibacteria group bacterium]|nr:YraN family protein [Patescibacteria group bacterium]